MPRRWAAVYWLAGALRRIAERRRTGITERNGPTSGLAASADDRRNLTGRSTLTHPILTFRSAFAAACVTRAAATRPSGGGS